MTESDNMLNSDFIRGFLEGAKRQGRDITAILKAAGIDNAAIDDNSDALIDGKQLQRLLITLTKEMDDVYIGFVKDRYKPVLNTAALKMSADCKTLGENVRVRTEFRESLRDDVHYQFRVNRKQHEFSLTVDDFELVEGMDPHLFYWLRLSTIYRYHSWLIGRRIKLNRVSFSSAEPEGSHAHLAMFNCEVSFNQPKNAVFFDDKYLHCPVIRTETEIMESFVYIAHHLDWFEVPGSDLSLARQVQKAIEALQDNGEFQPTIDIVAKQLRVNARRLRSQLARENESFQQIKAKVRQEAAIKKLLSTGLSVSTIALELGYIEPGDFSRNFKRWTGLSPSEYRAKHGKE